MQVQFSQHMLNDRMDRYVVIATEVGFGEVAMSIQRTDVRYGGKVTIQLTTTGVIIIKNDFDLIVTMYCTTVKQAHHLFRVNHLPQAVYKAIQRNSRHGYCAI